MSNRYVVPVRNRCCTAGPVAMPAGLYAHCHPDDFAASMGRIQGANSSPLLARVVYFFAWVGYIWGVLQVVGVPYLVDRGYYSQWWTGFTVLMFSLFAVIGVGRYMRLKRQEKVAAAVAAEHAMYAARGLPLVWSVVMHGWYRQLVEIEVQQSAAQQQIEMLQQQLATAQRAASAQAHQLQYDHALIHQQQQLAAQEAQVINAQQHFIAHQQHAVDVHSPHAHFYPAVPMPRTIYAPVQPSVFAHPPPQYYAAPPAPVAPFALQPQDMRAPLVHNQY